MLAVVLVSYYSHGKFNYLDGNCLDHQCVPDTGPCQCVQSPLEAYITNEREGKTCRPCCVSEMFESSITYAYK